MFNTLIESDRLANGLWADFGSRIAISEKNVRKDCLLWGLLSSLSVPAIA